MTSQTGLLAGRCQLLLNGPSSAVAIALVSFLKCAWVDVDRMLQGTRVIAPSIQGSWPTPGVSSGWMECQMSIAKGTVYEEAVKQASQGKRVVAVSAASSYHTGGGFKSGGRHALEESMCVQSTLFESLQKAERQAKESNVICPAWIEPKQNKAGVDWHRHIPDDGVVLSPYVEVFRGGTNDGYPFEEAVAKLEAVISVAMPNCNDGMSDSPVDKHPSRENYIAQLKYKWRAVLSAAAHCTSGDTLVVPDAGCGVFKNEPDQVGAALGHVLRQEFPKTFKEIIIAFPGGANGEEFAEHAQAAFQDRTPRQRDSK